MKILALDDEIHALNMLKSSISEVVTDAELYLCQTSESALLTAKQEEIDVAFLDIHMAGMDGVTLAYELKKINPRINIIFATGFSEYMKQGFDMHASGYLLKPVTSAAVKREMDNLRNPIVKNEAEKRVRVVTFGNFEVYVDNIPVKFERKQSKEIFAYLIDKRGTSATYAELAAMLWEDGDYDRTKQKNLQVYIASLAKTLNAAGVRDLILKGRTGIIANIKLIDCDYYKFLEGDTRAINSFTGQYMSAYSWAEFTTGYLDYQLQKSK
jgi:two-component SAPR family response regulator